MLESGRCGSRSSPRVSSTCFSPGCERCSAGEYHVRHRSPPLMPTGPRRPGFYLGVLIAGFVAGGALNSLVRQSLPESAARTFFTSTWTATFGPVSADLLVVSFTMGPIGLHVSLLSLIGVVLAYLIARSLF